MVINTQNKDYNRIKAVLADQKKTSKWLAEQLGKSENTVSRWCSNKIQPTIEILDQISILLNVDIRSLIRSNKEEK